MSTNMPTGIKQRVTAAI